MNKGVDIVEALSYKLTMFGVPIDGSVNMFCDNKAIYKNTIKTAYVLKKKYHFIYYCGAGVQWIIRPSGLIRK